MLTLIQILYNNIMHFNTYTTFIFNFGVLELLSCKEISYQGT